MPFYNWTEDGEVPVLSITGVIASETGWFDDEVTPKAFKQALDAHAGKEILVSIDSPGGDVFAGFDIYNMLAARRGKTVIRVIGLAASAASVIAMAAQPGCLQMARASMMMVHSPWAGGCGNAQELRKQAQVLDEIERLMVDIYMQRYTGSEEALTALLHEETYLSPTQAMEAGFCDTIVDPFELAQENPAAAMAGRYAALSAMDVRQYSENMRRALNLTRRREPPRDYVKLADEAIRRMK